VLLLNVLALILLFCNHLARLLLHADSLSTVANMSVAAVLE
jgi:hypothetical protein